MLPALFPKLAVLLKGTKRKINDYLEQKEVDCRCTYYSCKRTLLAESIEKSFLATRVDFGKAIYVTSGYRCQKHNIDIGGVGDSRHKLGLALDLKPKDNVDLDYLEEVARQHFDVVLRYPVFIHCHNEPYDK